MQLSRILTLLPLLTLALAVPLSDVKRAGARNYLLSYLARPNEGHGHNHR